MRALEVGSFQNGTAKIEEPSIGAFPAPPNSPLDYRQNSDDIRCRRFAKFFQFFSFCLKFAP